MRTRVADSRRLVVKLGSSIVADERGSVREEVLGRVCDGLAELRDGGREVIVVTSGAIARGMGVMELALRPRTIDELQAAIASIRRRPSIGDAPAYARNGSSTNASGQAVHASPANTAAGTSTATKAGATVWA